jgi:hypothetical protein
MKYEGRMSNDESRKMKSKNWRVRHSSFSVRRSKVRSSEGGGTLKMSLW